LRKQSAQQKKKQQRNILFAVVGAIVVLAAVLAVVFTAGGGDDKPAASDTAGLEQTRPVTVTGTALERYNSSANPDPAVGTVIPTVKGSAFDGSPVTITNDGKPKVLLFVAHWCPHCQREVPKLAPDLRENPLPAGVEMITVSTNVNSQAPNYPPSEWLADNSWPTPVMADDADSSAAAAFGTASFPYFVFTDAQGRVVSRISDEISVEEFRQRVNAIAPAN
jgi:thiol-disulfide isomerase/thioredoxin